MGRGGVCFGDIIKMDSLSLPVSSNSLDTRKKYRERERQNRRERERRGKENDCYAREMET